MDTFHSSMIDELALISDTDGNECGGSPTSLDMNVFDFISPDPTPPPSPHKRDQQVIDVDENDGLDQEESNLSAYVSELSMTLSRASLEHHRASLDGGQSFLEDMGNDSDKDGDDDVILWEEGEGPDGQEPYTLEQGALDSPLLVNELSRVVTPPLLNISNGVNGFHQNVVPPSTPVCAAQHIRDFSASTTSSALVPESLTRIYHGLVRLADHTHEDLICTYLLECCVRADVQSSILMRIATQTAVRSGMVLLRGKACYSLLRLGGDNTPGARKRSSADLQHWGQWTSLDIQVVIGMPTKHRLLVVRFMRVAEDDMFLSENSDSIAQAQSQSAPGIVSFVDSLKTELQANAANNGSLVRLKPGGGTKGAPLPVVDPQYLEQLEVLAYADLKASAEGNSKHMEEHAIEMERASVTAAKLLKPMFELYHVFFPPQTTHAAESVAAVSYEAMASRFKFTPTTADELQDLQNRTFFSEADRVLATCLARWYHCCAECDKELKRRMERKNREVMLRLSAVRLYLTELLQTLRDSHDAAISTSVVKTFLSHAGGIDGIDPDVEYPIFYCTGGSNFRPANLYLTYWRLVLTIGFPGIRPRIIVVQLKDISDIKCKQSLGFWAVQATVKGNEVKGDAEKTITFTPGVIIAQDLVDLLKSVIGVLGEWPTLYEPNDL